MYIKFREWFLVSEGQADQQTLKILNGDQNLLNQIKRISPDPKYMPIIAYFHVNERIPIEQMQNDIQSYKRFVDEKKLPMLLINNDGILFNNQPISYLKLAEKIHAIEGQIAFKNRDNFNDGEPIEGEAIFSKNGFDVYEAHGRKKCIQYGKGYSFCISQPNNTQWQSYRDTRSSTFYFVFDRNRTKQDPLHVVVVDHTASGFMLTDATNSTGNIAEFGANSESYIQYLESKGIPRTTFQHIEHSKEEKSDAIKFKKKLSLEDFIAFTHEEKSRFIGRGNALEFDQFKYLVDNKLDDLTHQYATTGEYLLKNSFDLISSNTNLLKSHLRSRIIFNTAMDENPNIDRANDYQNYEIPYLKQHFSKEMKEQIMKRKRPSLKLAFSLGFTDIIDVLIANGADDFSEAMESAASIGNIDMIKYMINKIPNKKDLNAGMQIACKKGYIDIVELMIDGGATDYKYEGIKKACENNHRDVIKLLIEKGSPAVDRPLDYASRNGDMEMIHLVVKKAEEDPKIHLDFEWPLYQAARNGHLEMVRFLISKNVKGANTLKDLNRELKTAASAIQIDVIDFLISKGANDFNGALLGVAECYPKNSEQEIELIKFFISKGANNFEKARDLAGDVRNKHIVDFLQKIINKQKIKTK